MKTNDIKKGARIVLRNGWYGTMKDNARGNTRIAEIEGYVTEMGSVYSHDIVQAMNVGETEWQAVEYTPAQEKLRKLVQFPTASGY